MDKMIEPGTILSITEDASMQDMGDGAVVLLADSGQLYTCNETTQAFLAKVDGQRSLGDIVALLCDEFEVDAATAGADFQLLAEELVSEGIVGAAR